MWLTARVSNDAHSPLSPGAGQKPFPGDGAFRKCVAAPKDQQKKQQETRERERERGKQQASGRPSPETQKRPRKGGAKPQKKPGAPRRPQKKRKQILAGRGKTQFERESGTEKQKNDDTPSERAKTNRVLCVNLSLILFSLTRNEGGERREEEKTPHPERTTIQTMPIS